MGAIVTKPSGSLSTVRSEGPVGVLSPRSSRKENIHPVNMDLKVHAVVSMEMDHNHDFSMQLPLGEVSDEQLLAEVARRRIDLHEKITDSMVKESYDIISQIGYGASGKVFLVSSKKNSKKYACKIVKKNSSMNDAQSMSTEIEIMKRTRHTHVISMIELYETPKCLWIILEYIDGGDLPNFISKNEAFCEVIAAKMLRNLLEGVDYLHSLGIVHRDLKPDNILFSLTSTSSTPAPQLYGSNKNTTTTAANVELKSPPILHSSSSNSTVASSPSSSNNAHPIPLTTENFFNFDIKIADFGLSTLIRIEDDSYEPDSSIKKKSYNLLHDIWGTKEYFAPEIISQSYGPQVDVWALGCILYEILSGEQAFPVKEGDTETKFYSRLKRGEYEMKKNVWNKISNEAKDLIKKMLHIDPMKRWTPKQCLSHPWITGECHKENHYQVLSDSRRLMTARLARRARRAQQQAEQAKLLQSKQAALMSQHTQLENMNRQQQQLQQQQQQQQQLQVDATPQVEQVLFQKQTLVSTN